MTRLAVLGSPIAHSKSPQLHSAAYRVLGLDWSYERIEQTEQTVADFVRGRGADWRGLSVTAPLKRAVIPALDAIDEVASLTDAVNTVLLAEGSRHGYNTDVAGIERAFARAGTTALESVEVLGAGATAASVLVAARHLGAQRATLTVREPARGTRVAALGERIGLDVAVRRLDASGGDQRAVPDAVVSTLPGASAHPLSFAESVRKRAVFFEVAYDPWPSALAASWFAVGGTVVDGLDMLIEQALVQVRIFAAGTPDAALDREDEVLEAMRAAVARP